MALNQGLQEGIGYSEQEFYFPSQEDEYGYEDLPQHPAQTVDQYLKDNQGVVGRRCPTVLREA